MLVLDKYKWDKYSYCINKQYILFIPNIILSIKWEIIKTFNLSDPIEKQLLRINGFYKVLSYTEEDELYKLYESVYYDNYGDITDKENPSTRDLEWFGMEDMWSFSIMYDYEEEHDYKKGKDCIIARYSEYQYWRHIQWLERGDEDDRYECYKKEEFNLLMQIYYWVYDDEKIKKELEEKEKKGEFEKMIKEWWELEKKRKEALEKYELIKKEKWLIEALKYSDKFHKEYYKPKKEEFLNKYKEKWEDYLKLQLLRKPTKWAFQELNIKKIYDKNWDEEEQKKVVEKINEELGEDVVILE